MPAISRQFRLRVSLKSSCSKFQKISLDAIAEDNAVAGHLRYWARKKTGSSRGFNAVEMTSGDVTRLLRSRYVWFWVRRHSALGANTLIALLIAAANAARTESRDIVLPELPADSADAGR